MRFQPPCLTKIFVQNLREVVDGYYAYMEESKAAARKTSASALNNACAAVAVASVSNEEDDLGGVNEDNDRIKARTFGQTSSIPEPPILILIVVLRCSVEWALGCVNSATRSSSSHNL